MSDDLAQFLRARRDEDERQARAAMIYQDANWRVETSGIVTTSTETDVYTDDRELAEHIARHDPARVLVEVEAGRVVLQQYESLLAVCSDDHTGVWAVEAIMRAKARAYRDHQDFDPAWLED